MSLQFNTRYTQQQGQPEAQLGHLSIDLCLRLHPKTELVKRFYVSQFSQGTFFL